MRRYYVLQIYVVPPDYVLLPPKDTEEETKPDAGADRAELSGDHAEIVAAAPEEPMD